MGGIGRLAVVERDIAGPGPALHAAPVVDRPAVLTVPGAAPEERDADDRFRPDRRYRWLPFVLWVLCAAVYALLSLARFDILSTPSWDNAIFQQAIDGYAHLRAPIVDIKGPGYDILGDHFSPILAILAPVYRLFPYAQTLLIAQAVLVASAVVPIVSAASTRIGVAGGVAVGIAYGLSFGVQSAVYTDFHEVAFAVPLLAFAGNAFLERRWWKLAAWTMPLLLVKEDLGMTVAAIGVVLLFIAGARIVGAVLVSAGVVGFILIVFVAIPAFNRSGVFDYWGAVSFGPHTPGPWHTFWVGWNTKSVTLLLTFGITGFLAFRSPWVLVAGPTLVWRWVGQDKAYWDTDWHYSLVLMPIVFIALIDAAARIRAQRRSPRWLLRYALHVPTAAAAIATVLVMQFPLHNLFKSSTYQPDPAAVTASSAAIAMIPPGATVETNLGLITHLVSGHHVYFYGTVGQAVPDYVLIDSHTPYLDSTAAVFAAQQHPGHSYQDIYDEDGYQLARRDDASAARTPAAVAAAAAGETHPH